MKKIITISGILLLIYSLCFAQQSIYYSEKLEKKAKQENDAEAQYELGVCYNEGKGVEEDYDIALRWFQRSAEQGYAMAQNHLGLLYFIDESDSTDKGITWLKKAAEQGYVRAQSNLGIIYKRGYNKVPVDHDKAVYWLKKAAEQDDGDACYVLGNCYEDGEGVEQDQDAAIYWYRKAAKLENSDAQNKLGMCFIEGSGLAKNPAKGIYWFRKAASHEDTTAQNILGYIYYHGIDVEQNYNKAAYWMKVAYYNQSEDAKSFWNKNELWQYKINQEKLDDPEPGKCILIGMAAIKNNVYGNDHEIYKDELMVTLKDSSGNRHFAFTDDNGFYYLSNVPPSFYTVEKLSNQYAELPQSSSFIINISKKNKQLINNNKYIVKLKNGKNAGFEFHSPTNEPLDYFSQNFNIRNWADKIGAVNSILLLDAFVINYDSISNTIIKNIETFEDRKKIKEYDLNAGNNGIALCFRNLSMKKKKIRYYYIIEKYDYIKETATVIYKSKKQKIKTGSRETRIIDHPLDKDLTKDNEYTLKVYLGGTLVDEKVFDIE